MNEPVEVLGLEHIYLTVSSPAVSEAFYDTLLVDVLGFRKSQFILGDEPHINYYNRHFGLVLRPARSATPHDNYAPGLHHLCLRVATEDDLRRAWSALHERGINASPVQCYAQYAEDYYATFLNDPDGIRLELSNFRKERQVRFDGWEGIGE
ncbi:VOC family protein [Dechloromonas sp. ARDL1]|uniref:VOC family protein n=1 Tax=Dechloromonas sp. ARDL1 TaxID=3322121 RepID=UPI003DA73C3B